jgi:hypothetical protein
MSIKVHFTCTFQEPQAWGMAGADWAERMGREYAESKDSQFQLVDDPNAAEIIVFWEPFQASQETWAPRLREHPLVKAFPEKVYAVSPEDCPLGFLRGLYCSLPRRSFNPERHRTWIYQGTLNPFIESEAQRSDLKGPDYLASFIGAPSHAVRVELQRRKEQFLAQGILVEATKMSQFNADPSHASHREQQLRYIHAILNSKFSLCPRGNGAGSFRLQESMALGRAPVILGDDWVPITGPDWKRCAIFVAEKDVPRLPELLEKRKDDWQEMGRAARVAWEEFFRPDQYAVQAMRQIYSLHQNGGARARTKEMAVQAKWNAMIRREQLRRNPLMPRVIRKLKRVFARMA